MPLSRSQCCIRSGRFPSTLPTEIRQRACQLFALPFARAPDLEAAPCDNPRLSVKRVRARYVQYMNMFVPRPLSACPEAQSPASTRAPVCAAEQAKATARRSGCDVSVRTPKEAKQRCTAPKQARRRSACYFLWACASGTFHSFEEAVASVVLDRSHQGFPTRNAFRCMLGNHFWAAKKTSCADRQLCFRPKPCCCPTCNAARLIAVRACTCPVCVEFLSRRDARLPAVGSTVAPAFLPPATARRCLSALGPTCLLPSQSDPSLPRWPRNSPRCGERCPQ